VLTSDHVSKAVVVVRLRQGDRGIVHRGRWLTRRTDRRLAVIIVRTAWTLLIPVEIH
jgi:hypothetical protein